MVVTSSHCHTLVTSKTSSAALQSIIRPTPKHHPPKSKNAHICVLDIKRMGHIFLYMINGRFLLMMARMCQRLVTYALDFCLRIAATI